MKRPFSLSPRLQAVAGLVPEGSKLVDVGTDHGRLPVWLIQHARISQAVATDLRPGPLSRAQALAQRWGLADQISFRLCDGLSKVSPQEAETVTITGMGGETIAGILAACPWAGEPGRRYIFQPMSGMDGLRRYLSGHGFSIDTELLIPEADGMYVILLAQPGPSKPLSEGEIWVGRQTRETDSPLRGRYLAQELVKLCRAVDGLERSERGEDKAKLTQYRRCLQEVTALKEEWEQWHQ